MDPQQILEGIFWFVAFLFSTTVHEAAHAWAAMVGGDRTAYYGGQVSLSPLPHIRREPIGMVVVPLLTSFLTGWAVGWASAPYDPDWAERHPRRAAAMAAAGPAGNFLLAVLAGIALKAGLALGVFVPPRVVNFGTLVAPAVDSPGSLVGFAAQLLSILLMLNVLLGAFNLFPLPPLDGSSVLMGFLPDRPAAAFRRLSWSPQFSLVGLLVAWQLFPYVARPLFGLVVRILHPNVPYI
jgi:Zn-dependent protease